MQILGTLAFVVALLLSVMFHELGHFLTARRFGMKVTEFFLGFGKRIWSFRRGETEYGLKAIPAGGYCRIEGMTPQDEMPEGEETRAFIKASSARKLIVLGAGSFAHIVLGFLLIFSIFFAVGYTVVEPKVAEVVKDSPAAAAGLLAGDEIIAIDGVKISKWEEDVQKVAESDGKELTFTVKRNGSTVDVAATPQYNSERKRYVLGIINSLGNRRDGFFSSIASGSRSTWYLTIESAKSLVSIPTKLPQLVRETFMGEKRDPNGLVGVVGAARVSGQVASSDALNTRETLATFILMVASLNIFVALFNLLPLLPLDGGHMAVAVADEIRALFARIRKRPRPDPIDVNVLTPVTMAVFVLMVGLTVLLLIADIFNPVSLNL